jgi:hypothetical protein
MESREERAREKTGNRQIGSASQFGGGKMDISHARSHMSVRPNEVGFLMDRGRNGVKGKEG